MTIPSEAMQGEIAPGERVLWSGPPVQGLRFESEDLPKSSFGLIFFAFSVFWVHGASIQSSGANSTSGSLFPLFGVPFVLIGFYLLVGHFFWRALGRKYSEYAVTNQRVIMRSGILGKTTKSIEYHRIPSLVKPGASTPGTGYPTRRRGWRPFLMCVRSTTSSESNRQHRPD
jgi:hypothetical protein